MRWQRHSDSDVKLWRPLAPLAVGLLVLMVAGFTQVRTAAPAEGEEIGEGGETVDISDVDTRGMSASNPRVKSMLWARPNEFVTICVAGCDGKPGVVQTLPKPLEKRTAAMRTTAADGAAGGPQANYGGDTVTCMAGCGGRPGQVVQRMPGLPPPKAAPAPDGNEPLDIR